MSVGTIVTIVLLMSVLILGIFLVQKVFSSGTNAINQIDVKLSSQIDALFADEGKKIAIMPNPLEGGLVIKQGEEGGFALSIQNKYSTDRTFEYSVSHIETGNDCSLTPEQANGLLGMGKAAKGLNLPSGQSMETPILVKFDITENVPLCEIRYIIEVRTSDDGKTYSTALMDVKII